MANKVMTWVLIMTLLISQSFAYASVPCEINGDSMSQHNNAMAPQSLVRMDHSMPEHDMPNHMQHDMQHDMPHDMPQEMQQQKLSMNCCDQECSCPSGTYSSVTLTHFTTAAASRLVSDSSGFYLFSIQDAFLPSLRKPPLIG